MFRFHRHFSSASLQMAAAEQRRTCLFVAPIANDQGLSDKLIDLSPFAAHLDGGFIGCCPSEFRDTQARKIGSDFGAHADADALDYRS
jgi:hypothetical protein